MHVSHKKISVATSDDRRSAPRVARRRRAYTAARFSMPASRPRRNDGRPTPVSALESQRRRLYFEDVEVRRSRTKGIACRVTLRKGDETYVGEAEGMENERMRIELAARAALAAIRQAEGDERVLAFEGCKMVDAFEREFVFVGVTSAQGARVGDDRERGDPGERGDGERAGGAGCDEPVAGSVTVR